MNKIKWVIWLLIIVLVVAVSVIFYRHIHSKKTVTAPAKNLLVTVEKLQYHAIPQTVLAYGQVVAPQSVVLRAQTAGIITTKNFTPGEKVTAGSTLLTLKSNDTSTQLEKLAAQMQTSKQTYLRSARAAKLVPGAISRDQLQTQKLQYEQDLAAYNEARDIHNIVAPIDGTITESRQAVGDFVNEGDMLATIVDRNKLQISYQVPSTYVDEIKPEQHVYFITQAQRYAARVIYVAPHLNADNQGLTIRAEFTGDVPLLPNDFSQVEQIINPDAKALALKDSLVQTDAQGFYVYVYKNDKATKEYFVPGQLTKNGLITVQSGLTENEAIITTDPKTLTADEKVRVK